jgi:hypothetical protein
VRDVPVSRRCVIYGSRMSTGDITDPAWADKLRRALDEAREASTARMRIEEDLLAAEWRIDDLEARLETIEDPAERERAETWVLQARLNNKLGETDTHLLAHITQLQEAVLVLADGLRRLQGEAG